MVIQLTDMFTGLSSTNHRHCSLEKSIEFE